jgi:DNA-binding beta-propeller fold protein YncE
MKRTLWAAVSGLLLSIALVAVAFPAGVGAAERFPKLIGLPDGWQPEGIVTGRGPVLYAGSLAGFGIYEIDLRTGEGQLLADGEGRTTVGLSFDQRTNYIFAAGGPDGSAYVFDADSGELVRTYTFDGAGFVNDVIVTRQAAYFTDSFSPVLYRVELGPGGRLPNQGAVETISLSRKFRFEPGEFNANGIEATPNGKSLIVVNSTLGKLYRIDPDTGEATRIVLGGESVTSGDGILLQGKTLYVVRNQLNQIAVIRLSPDLRSGTLIDTITDDNFDVPTTLALFGSRLYAVNARFGTPPTPTTEYSIVRLKR